jgi:hypothetical protein
VVRIDDVLADVAGRTAPRGIRIIGVDGPAGSGKSTLAARLAARAGVPLIQVDDFVSWSDFSGWWPRFDAQVLTPLSAGEPAHYELRDWVGDEFGNSLRGWRTVPWAPLVIVEGVTCTRRAASGELTYRIWVDAPPDVRLSRGLARDGESHRDLWLRWMEQEEEFFAADRPAERADLRVDGAVAPPSEDELIALA